MSTVFLLFFRPSGKWRRSGRHARGARRPSFGIFVIFDDFAAIFLYKLIIYFWPTLMYNYLTLAGNTLRQASKAQRSPFSAEYQAYDINARGKVTVVVFFSGDQPYTATNRYSEIFTTVPLKVTNFLPPKFISVSLSLSVRMWAVFLYPVSQEYTMMMLSWVTP